MSQDVAGQVVRRVEEVGPSVAIALEFPMSQYFDVLRGLVDLTQQKDLKCIYITAAVPSTTILATFEALEINTENIAFVDCISQMIMGERQKTEKIIYVESPTILENIVLKVEFLMRKMGPGQRLVVVDSINSLAIHNDTKMLSEFLHVLISGLSPKEAYPVMLSTAEGMKPDVKEMLNLVCDQVINLQHPD